MAVFTYQACPAGVGISGSPKVLSGTIAADSPRHARELLRERELDVLAVEQVRRSLGLAVFKAWLPQRSGRYESRVVIFVREFSTLLAVGTPMLQALDTAIGPQVQRLQQGRLRWPTLGRCSGFYSVLLQLRDRVAAGAAFSDAMSDHPDVFDDLTRRLVEVGEKSGTLDQVLDKLAGFKERSASFRGRLTNAMIYPIIVLTMAVLVTILLMTFVVPNILKPLVESGRPLPFVTQAVKSISDTVLGWWWLIGFILIGVVCIATALLRSKKGQHAWHRWQLKLPGVGEVVRKQETVRVATVVHTLIDSGVAFLSAIQIAQRTVRNQVFKDALAKIGESVGTGQDIAEAMRETDAFPPTVVQVFALGQASGRLGPMLERLSTDYDKQVQQAAQRLTVLLEPVMILILAVLIGFIAFATILPVLEAGHVL